MMLWDYIPQWVFFCYNFLHSCDQNVKWEYSKISLILKKKFTTIPLIPSLKSWLKWNLLALKNALHADNSNQPGEHNGGFAIFGKLMQLTF